jgi:hypothetical protein
MHCEDMNTANLMFIRGANGRGFSAGRSQCNSTAQPGAVALVVAERDRVRFLGFAGQITNASSSNAAASVSPGRASIPSS